MTEWISKANPWEPPDYNDDVIYAIRALHEGVANQAQQKLFWRWLQYSCGSSDMSFRPDDKGGERATTFAEGKRFAGHNVQKFLHPMFTPKTPALNTIVPPTPNKKRKRK